MRETYGDYILRHLSAAESALFEARNAYMGTGIESNDSKARRLENMRVIVASMLLEEKRGLETA